MARRKRTTREAWAKRVEQWQRSGHSAAAYAAQIGVNARTLGNWAWKLQQDRAGEGAKRSAVAQQVTRGPRSATAVSFVELMAPLEPAAAERFEIVLRSGAQLRVPVQFESEALRRLLDVLEAR